MNENAFDSDDDNYHHQFQVKERVDFVDPMNNFQTGSIEMALDEMVKCVSEVTQINQKPVINWIGTESDTLAAPNSLVANEKRKWHIFYMNLLRTIPS